MIEETRLLESLDELIGRSGVKVTDLARSIDVPYRTLQKQLSGESRMSAITLLRILEVFDVGSRFILEGNLGIDTLAMMQSIEDLFGQQVPTFEILEDGISVHDPFDQDEKASLGASATFTVLLVSLYHENRLNNLVKRFPSTTKEFSR